MKIIRRIGALYFLLIGSFEVYAQFRNTIFTSLGNELISQVIYLSLGLVLVYTAFCLWKNRRNFLPFVFGLLCLVGTYSLFSVYILTYNTSELLTTQLQQVIYYLTPILLLFGILRNQANEHDGPLVRKFVNISLVNGRALVYLIYLSGVILILTGIITVEVFHAPLAVTNKTLNSILLLGIGFLIYLYLNFHRKRSQS
ncbi:hypothetical protein A2631_03470 [Candidatus Daviesbacteria bacterium RIFCSPHIGHO2_01_FULL_44_29]|uniref:Uncharacterized protein n=1 Tax=Candidatus Daviesbacteria bacterium RIFCSPHIGHO2_02_FULL_43_12 TaxID=1797776 RepID=A0A1F5KFW7_9BACT|nr:MAG: hypothetical protein A2631_03470 [Candidatus Daviesbacteria bacterium RIFCSPHIGHO2_01_FULL_44_29]OGE38842.1 MAG: hypothetical protein A3E86_02915 [Candidatus Daviesbacteria bacterium RIFCSPHIGHO2_12_FULL_47_45]OGE39739.1 MAG: hypothetical protein A3D25_03355 [Candidatus Daviesbacteria bacterium RIFCSPHIGHO2_02_FULL_43_12]OGE69970.1 MAG: hypothetical protein A3B55_04735 [Candidatus Daviesbacteria bacterium RIFCSPLOWO2_01_FULL_43_15]